jgi:hypothetical protein
MMLKTACAITLRKHYEAFKRVLLSMNTLLAIIVGLSGFTALADETDHHQTDAVMADAAMAEVHRISDEIRALGRRQIWSGVERKYLQLLKLEKSTPSDVHLVAAYSARERGELLSVYDRLSRAAQGKATQTVVDWLWDLDHNYGRVELIADRRRTAKLVANEMPLDPSPRKAVQTAIEVCDETGKFKGLLPRGGYSFVGQTFRVEPGISVRVEVSPKMRRQGMNEPTIVYRELPTAVVKEKD